MTSSMARDAEQYGYGYEIHTYTGFRSHAQTKSKVQIKFTGTEGKSDEMPLNNPSNKKVIPHAYTYACVTTCISMNMYTIDIKPSN